MPEPEHQEYIVKSMTLRELSTSAIRDEIENLFEDATEDDERFDQLLADIDELIQEYRL